jgi:tetratricopeptide (TPR) repeat protein
MPFENHPVSQCACSCVTAKLIRADMYELYSLRSQINIRLGSFADAQADVNALLELAPKASEARYREALLYVEAAHFEEAQEVLKLAIALDPLDTRVYALQNTIQVDVAKHTALRALEKGKQEFVGTYYIDAKASFTQAIQSNPYNVLYRIYRACAHLAAGDYQEANDDAMEAIRIQPGWADAQPLRSGYLTKVGRINRFSNKKRYFVLRSRFIYYYVSV